MSEDPIAEKLLASLPHKQRNIEHSEVIENTVHLTGVFNIDHYFSLSEQKMAIVDAWLKYYDLLGPATKICSIDNHSEWKLEVWGWVDHKHFIQPNRNGFQDLRLGYDRYGNQTETLIATFSFNDFPWEVLDD
jgi:hypothetical protein